MIAEDLSPGNVLPSRNELSTLLGINPATTLRACHLLIAQGILQREGYKLRVAPAGRDPLSVQGTVYVISCFSLFHSLAEKVLTERGINHRQIKLSWTRDEGLDPVLRKIFAEKPAGVIISTGRAHQALFPLLEANPVPLVLCSAGAISLNRSSVQIDLYRATEKALSHLFELGHRHLAFVSLTENEESKELENCYRTVCLQLGLAQSTATIWRADSTKEEVVRNILLTGRENNPEVTAIFGDTWALYCATKIFAVPEEISVVGVHGLPDGIVSKPPLTTLGLLDPEAIVQWACTDLISQIQTIESGRPPRTPYRAYLLPDLRMGKSTRALTALQKVPGISNQPPRISADSPWETWRKVYPFVAENSAQDWQQLDLSKLTNHSMTRQHGWLGEEPLKHFPPGLRSIHGVPFLVLDEDRNEGSSVITFRSPHTHSARMKQLPTRVNVKVFARVKALYFLHGCGHASPVIFAEYIMHFRSGDPLSVPLIPLGPSRRLATERLGQTQHNLQDWWGSTFEQEHFPHAHQATVFDPANPLMHQRSLYSLEWINPQPKEELSFIEVRVKPKAGPVLALIAVTALR